MPQIRPVSDLRNRFAEISRIVHETAEPVYLTKNGYGDMVVMSMDAYAQKKFEDEVYLKLREAELEARSGEPGKPYHDVMRELRAKLAKHMEG